LGLVFHWVSGGAIAISLGMVIGVLSLLVYTLFGGMWSVAITDFVQMLVLVIGLGVLAFFAAEQAGGAQQVVALAQTQQLLHFWPEANMKDWLFFIAAGVTMMLGSSPQQDVFQRVMSANSLNAATKGPLIGGICYILFAFVPMFLVVGLTTLAVFAGHQAGGADKVLALAVSQELFKFLPEPNMKDILFFVAAAITIMFGSIPQQDVFQRVMSANSLNAATKGPIIGGICYILFAFVPMFLVVSALIIMPEQAAQLIQDDPQKVLPTLVMTQMPFVMQVLFFGALLSAIKSCASATLLAPSVTFTENIWRQFFPHQGDKQSLLAMRVTVLVFSALVLLYAIQMQGSSIYEMVSGAYQVTLVGAFVPLLFGLYWSKATTQGAIFSIALGLSTWLLLLMTPAGEEFPAQLAGVLASLAGMLIGSLAPQALKNKHGAHHVLQGTHL
jgi:Na+/proline symporter